MAAASRPRALRLIAIGPTPPPTHGVSIATQRLVADLQSLGLLAAHLDTRDPRPLGTMGILDVQNVVLGLKHAGQLCVLLARHRGAAVHLPLSQELWGFLRDAVFLWIAKLWRRPRLVYLHGADLGNWYRSTPLPLRLFIRATLAGTTQAWVLTPALRPVFDGLVRPDRLRIVENVVDDVPPEARAQAGRATAGLRLLCLGNLVPSKGCFELLDALERLGEHARGWEVRFVGSDYRGTADRVRARAADLEPLGIRVELTGPKSGADKAAELGAADVFVYPTKHDAQPLVLLEAAAAGLPIVTTRTGGIADTLRDGQDALVVDAGDVEGLADALRAVAADPGLRERLAASARRRYEERYVPARLVDDLRRLLAA